jgi:Calcineurin-like phosphoesterase
MASSSFTMPTIDVIGDIHGYADKLRKLLSRLGYEQTGGVYGSPDRKAIFVGDLIDRGPAIGEVMEIVEGMLHAGTAQIVMGNHEFNALCYHTPDGKGGYLRSHCKKNCDQHAATLAYFEKNPGAAERALAWFYTFPLWLDLGFARVVHAAWSPAAIQILKAPYLTPETVIKASTKGTPEYWAVETLLKGVEATLPEGLSHFDKDGRERTQIRVRWWLKPDSERTVAETVFPPDPGFPNTRFTTSSEWEPYELTEPPVIFGHYWLPKDWSPAPIMSNVICVDYSVGKGGPLVAYSLDPAKAREGEFTSAE